INAVDEVTQWQVAGSTPRISEAYLEPVLEHMLRQFPFRILGFHSDNGSEFINKTVARLLEKLRVEQTKSRPRQRGDNGLVETKNGTVIRKHIGYGYIDAKHADAINDFYCALARRNISDPYLASRSFRNSCAQASGASPPADRPEPAWNSAAAPAGPDPATLLFQMFWIDAQTGASMPFGSQQNALFKIQAVIHDLNKVVHAVTPKTGELTFF
ncbi:MAG: integrase catalytic domain-containing protein, partial [Acidobacteriaceae bacterium]